MLVSKLKTTYKTADPEEWLSGKWEELDPVFAGRLAHLARQCKVKIVMTCGYRSTAEQTRLYNEYLNYKRTGKGSIKLAARPGTSWHEYRLAIDTSVYPIRGMTDKEMRPYGLIKPIKSEPWHIQPIETSGESNRAKWRPKEQEDEMAETIYKTLSDVPSWGKATVEKLIANGGLTPSNGEINLTHTMLRVFVALDKMNII